MAPDLEPETESLTDQAIDWLVLLRSGNVNASIQREFEAWYGAGEAHREAFAEAEALWGAAATALRQDRASTVAARQRRPVRRRVSAPIWAAAASILFAVCLAWRPIADWAESDYRTGFGEQRRLTLADGSSVLLNTDSALAVDLSGQRRSVRLLHGQAEFRVAKDTARPFVVEADGASVTALGTVFDVFAGGSRVEVAVSEHAVEVVSQSLALKLRIEEGQLWRHVRGKASAQPSNADMAAVNAWKRGKFIFQDRTLAEVVAELNRYSASRIMIKDADLEQLRLSGVFPLDAEQVLTAVEDLLNIRATRLGPWLVVLHA
ncbi:FecR family protein [Methylomonas koyamae]|uniref:Iron dicitrate transport regulator FecR n=1 Tax=Methylomonas koyamae TaxID=702114 RepID=A0AA91DGD6_9GAMM|nr:FecR family protein [Methylomonas koyamae]OAI30316.1 hypothetical protein A1356_21665 [Methylomonas koyamae]